MWTRLGLPAASTVLLLALAACGTTTNAADRQSSVTPPSTSSTSSTAVPSSSTPAGAVAAPPPCDGAAVDAVVARWNRYASVTSFGCSGAFAYAVVSIMGPPPYVGGTGTVLMTGSAGEWTLVNRASYCADGSVPAAISGTACQGA